MGTATVGYRNRRSKPGKRSPSVPSRQRVDPRTLTVQPNQSILASDKFARPRELPFDHDRCGRSNDLGFYSWMHCLMTRYLLVEVAELATATLC